MIIENKFEDQIGRITHDLRGPLVSIVGLARLGRLNNDPVKLDEIFEMIESSARKLERKIDEVCLDPNISQELKTENFAINQVIQDSIKDLQFIPDFNSIDINVGFNGPGIIRSVKSVFHSAVQNLIENAVKYRDPDKKSFLNIYADCHDNGSLLVFEDNGIGIEPSIQEKVFHKNFRGTSQGYGSGLGLYLVKSGIESLGGKVTLESSLGFGTIVTVFLPSL